MYTCAPRIVHIPMPVRKTTPAKKRQSTTKAPVRSSQSSRAPKAAKASVVKKPAVKKASKPRASALPSEAFYPYGIERHGDLAWHMARFRKNVTKLGDEGSALALKALTFAEEKHKDQVRADGSLFIIHPVRIANILLSEWSERDASMVAAAILHDVIEDTHATTREVKDAFGDAVTKLVDGMTMWKGSETHEVYLQRITRGTDALRRIKCADALDNLRSWHECPPSIADRFPRWWRQTKDYLIPIAERSCRPAAVMFKQMIEDPWYLGRAGMN